MLEIFLQRCTCCSIFYLGNDNSIHPSNFLGRILSIIFDCSFSLYLIYWPIDCKGYVFKIYSRFDNFSVSTTTSLVQATIISNLDYSSSLLMGLCYWPWIPCNLFPELQPDELLRNVRPCPFLVQFLHLILLSLRVDAKSL